jgi:hypothetical protein
MWGDGAEICKGKVSCDGREPRTEFQDIDKSNKKVRHGVGDMTSQALD